MAQYLNHFVWRLLMLSLMSASALAETFVDPTKPPLALLGELQQAVERAPAGPVLQSITLGSEIKSAMISGETVLVGQQYKQWRLVNLTATHALLKTAAGTTKRLSINYSVKKTDVQYPIKPNVANRMQQVKSEYGHE